MPQVRKFYWGSSGAGVLPVAASTGRVLVGLRSYEVLEPGTWGAFGGRVEPGEDPIAAAEREFREETEYLGNIKLVPVYVFKDRKAGFTYHNYIGIVEDEFVPILNWENNNYRWMTLTKLNRLREKHPGLKALLANIDVRSMVRVRAYKKAR